MIEIAKIKDSRNLHRPRRVLKYVLICCTGGGLKVVIDDTEFVMTAMQVITITSGQIHFLKETENAEGFILEFTFDFFCKNDNDLELVFHNSLFCHFAMNEVIPIDSSQQILHGLNLIEKELHEKPYQYLISVHSRIELILVEINRCKISRGGEVYKPDALFLKFLEMVRADFSKNRSISQIAENLNTTESKLNELSKFHTGKTAQNVVYGLIISEAKRLFSYEKLSVKEVAYQLGFNDPFYFSNFFKKHTGISPSVYRKSLVS